LTIEKFIATFAPEIPHFVFISPIPAIIDPIVDPRIWKDTISLIAYE